MSSSKDWVDVDSDDLHTNSSDEEDHSQQGFSLIDENSSNTGTETPLAKGEQEEVADTPAESPFSRLSVPSLETAFATLRQASFTQAPEPNPTPINFDADDDSDISNVEGMEQERWQKTDAYMRDMQQASRQRPAVKPLGNERHMKILLIGEHGLGKEAFIKNVFAPYCSDDDLPVNMCEVDTSLRAFRDCPSDFSTEVIIDVDGGRTKIHYFMQDTPGTHVPGSENIALEYVRKQNGVYMAMEQDSRRTVPMSSLPDPRVDIALYFLSPFFVKPQDISTIARLSAFVPVVPVIAKADALTTAELSAHRQEVRQQLKAASEQMGRPVMHTFSADELKAAGAVREVPPFAVITSSEVEPEVGRHWFTRTFPWGKCEVMSSNHSDLPALKSLLFECCFESIKAATEARFYSARETFLTTRALSSRELPSTDQRKPSILANTVAAVNAAKPPKKTKESSGWKWTIGLVAVAVILQAAALGYYANSLQSKVDAYQAESAAEKQEFQDLLRAQLLAIEHKRESKSTLKSFFSPLWRRRADTPGQESAGVNIFPSIAAKLSGQMDRVRVSARKAAVAVREDIAKDWRALKRFTKTTASKAGSSLRTRAHSVASGVAKGFHDTNKKVAQYCAATTRRAVNSTFNTVSSAKTACTRSAKTGFAAIGRSIRAGAEGVSRTTVKGVNSTGHHIGVGASKLKRAVKHGLASGSNSVSQSTAKLGRAVACKVQEAKISTGRFFRQRANSTRAGLRFAANSTVSYTKGVWASRPPGRDVRYWFSKRSKSIARILRRTTIAALLQ